jgi:hypothetical protein
VGKVAFPDERRGEYETRQIDEISQEAGNGHRARR